MKVWGFGVLGIESRVVLDRGHPPGLQVFKPFLILMLAPGGLGDHDRVSVKDVFERSIDHGRPHGADKNLHP